MTVRVYKSTDAGAPSLTNTAGSLISVLDWCLVSGASTPAGWTKEYSGTNKAAYKQGTGSNGFYLRVDDTGTTLARVVGYETMTDVDTGTNPFPTNVQQSGGLYWTKNQDANLRSWVIVATEKAFFFYPIVASTYNQSPLLFFGDIQSYKAADAYNTLIIGGINSTVGSISQIMGATGTGATPYVTLGHFIARSSNQTTLSSRVGKIAFQPFLMGETVAGSTLHENPVNGKIFLSRFILVDIDGDVGIRGVLPGLYIFGGGTSPYGARFGDIVEVAGTDSVAGKNFMLVSSDTDTFLIETSDNW